MTKYKNLGQLITMDISAYGHEGISVDALYNFDEEAGKYLVTMFALKRDEEGNIQWLAPIQKPQHISSTRGTIRSDIQRIIEYMCAKNIISNYI